MKSGAGKNDIYYMAVGLGKVDGVPHARQLGLRCLGDTELLGLHRAGTLSQIVNYRGPLKPQNYVELDFSIRSRLEAETLSSILGKRGKLGEDRFLQVPSHLEGLRDRLFYLLLEEVDWEASGGNLPQRDYKVDRGKTTLCFYDDRRRIVALIPGGEIDETAMPDFIPPDLRHPQVEVAALLNQKEVAVLDAGIGRSTTIYSVMRRLKELGKRATGYGINLTAELSPVESAVPIFTGKFEEYPFPVGFDLVYCQVGSSFYTPNIPKYLGKLRSILRPGGVALLDIANSHLWLSALTAAQVNFTPLYNINRFRWMGNPRLIDPSGLLIRC